MSVQHTSSLQEVQKQPDPSPPSIEMRDEGSALESNEGAPLITKEVPQRSPLPDRPAVSAGRDANQVSRPANTSRLPVAGPSEKEKNKKFDRNKLKKK